MKQKYLFAFLLAIVAGLQSVKAQEAYAVYNSDNTTLTFYYDTQRASRSGQKYVMNSGESQPGWYGLQYRVTKVVFDPSFANARPTSTCDWFWSMTNLESITGLAYLNTSEVTTMSSMFSNCKKLTNIDVSHFNTAKVTNMRYMFSSCEALTSLDVSNFNTANVTNMQGMFGSCYALTSLDLNSFNTANVIYMSNMFSQCTHLTDINVSSFNTSNVTRMEYMFNACFRLESLDVSNFNTPQVTSMQDMFKDCRVLKILDLSSFNTANVTIMMNMFGFCWELTTIYAGEGWTTDAVTSSGSMFYDDNKLVGGQGTTFDGNHIDASYAHIDGGTSNPGYFTKKPNKRGDVNLDGTVDIADAVCVLNAMAGQPVAGDANVNGDFDDKGNPVIDIADLVTVLNIMAGQ